VQIIEITAAGIRSAVLTLRRRETPMRFVVFPMLHVGTPEFYDAVADRVRRCDIAVVEGVSGRSPLLRALTLSYRAARFNRRTRLVTQSLDCRELGVPVVRPDVDADQFEAGWRKVPLSDRLLVWAALPVVMTMRLFGGSRLIWYGLEDLNDLPSDLEQEYEFHNPEMYEALMHERDRRLLAALSELHERHCSENIDVAVVYGAAHVPAVVHGLLLHHGYRARGGEWLTVADL
jgi:hypothetical protein